MASAKKTSTRSRSRKLKVFKLSMKKWLRGGTGMMDNIGQSMLWSPHYRVGCCLGQLALQCGLTTKRIASRVSPEDLSEKSRKLLPPKLFKYPNCNSDLAEDVMSINDGPASDEVKISRLRPLFRKLGYQIEVVP